MKKIYSIFFAAAGLFAAASCQKEVSNPEIDAPKGDVITITATTDAETKTTLNGMATLWAASDQISVFDSNKDGNNRCFEINDECDGKETATFSYEGEFVMPQNGQTDPTVVALYPYQANAYCDFFYYDHADITGLNIEAEQTAVEDGFDADATFAIALGTLSTKDELKFSNLYSLLKFTVLDAGVKKVTVTVEGEDAFIAGDARIDLTINLEAGDGKPVFENPILSATTSKTVTLSCEGGFEIGKTYYIAVAPTTYTGISVALDEKVVKTAQTGKTLAANTVYNLGNLSEIYASTKSKWGLVGSMTEWAAGKDIAMYEFGDYHVAKGIEIKSTDEFKFRYDGNWDKQISGGIVAPNTKRTAGWVNMTISEAGTYDVYIDVKDKNSYKYYIMTPGKTPSDAKEPGPITITVIYDGDKDRDYLHLWSDGGEVANNMKCTSSDPFKWTVTIPAGDQQNRDYQAILKKGSAWNNLQTADSEKMCLRNPMPLKISDKNKAVHK